MDAIDWGAGLRKPGILEVNGIPLVVGTPIQFTSGSYAAAIRKGETATVSFIDRVRGYFKVITDLGNQIRTFHADQAEEFRLFYAHDYSFKTFQTKFDLEVSRLTRISKGLPAPADSFLINPHLFETSVKPVYPTTHDYLRWEPNSPTPATIYSNPAIDHTNLNGQSFSPSPTTHVYKQTESQSLLNQQQQDYARKANEWANKIHAANQTTSTHVQQASYLQQVGHEASKTRVESREIGF